MQKSEDGSKRKQVLNLKSGEYQDVGKSRPKGLSASKKLGPRAIFEAGDEMGEFAWVVMRDTLLYAASLIPEISDDLADVDAAMRDGYNAKWGPFELIDQLGVDWFSRRVEVDGKPLPTVLKIAENRSFYQIQSGQLRRLVFDFQNQKADYADLLLSDGMLSLAHIKRRSKPLLSHYSASLWDLGDGVACLEFHSKMNTLDPSTLWVANQTVQFLTQNQDRFKALVIYNEEKNFSLGANLGLVEAGFQLAKVPAVKMLGLSRIIELSMYRIVEEMVYQGQSVFDALRTAPFPVVGAPHGMAIGGGCEILLHCNALQASSETYMGLVETGVGVVPAWGGCIRYLERCQHVESMKGGPVPLARTAFQTIMMPQFSVSTSAPDAQHKLWLQPGDAYTMNRDRLLAEAKAKALKMAIDYVPPEPVTFRLPGPFGKSSLHMAIDDFYTKGDATYHDVVVADALASILTGGETDASQLLNESDIAQLERENFISLLKTAQTKKRINHTLKTGKPLREDPVAEEINLDDLRKTRKSVKLAQRPLRRQPLTGSDEAKLRLMAEVSAFLLKKVAR